jgi:hypothetical protein
VTVEEALRDELAMLGQSGYCTSTERWLEGVLTDVNPDVGFDGGIHNLYHSLFRRIVRETLMRIYGTLLWVSTDLQVLENPKPHYLLGVIAIERSRGICVTWNKHTKSPYLYRHLYSVDDFVRLLEEVDLGVSRVLGDGVRSNYSEAVTTANQTSAEIAHTYKVFVAYDADIWDVVEYLCDNPKLCPILKGIAKRTRETFPDASITYRVYQDPEIDDKYLVVQVKPSQPDDTANEKLDQILGAVSSKFKGVSGRIQLVVEP